MHCYVVMLFYVVQERVQLHLLIVSVLNIIITAFHLELSWLYVDQSVSSTSQNT